MPPNTATTVWAYDEFELKPGKTNPGVPTVIKGFRCGVASSSIVGAHIASDVGGFFHVFAEAAALSCLRLLQTRRHR